jgi:hypothetical protein
MKGCVVRKNPLFGLWREAALTDAGDRKAAALHGLYGTRRSAEGRTCGLVLGGDGEGSVVSQRGTRLQNPTPACSPSPCAHTVPHKVNSLCRETSELLSTTSGSSRANAYNARILKRRDFFWPRRLSPRLKAAWSGGRARGCDRQRSSTGRLGPFSVVLGLGSLNSDGPTRGDSL